MFLFDLKAVKGSRKRKKRLGCGESSGHGKTCGRGGKGQTARTGGKVRAGFEGGQMPLYRRLPKYGFRSQAKIAGLNVYSLLNLGDLERFENGSTLDVQTLEASGMLQSGKKAGVKILGAGTLTKKLHLKVNAVSRSAKIKIEELGGSVEVAAFRPNYKAEKSEQGG